MRAENMKTFIKKLSLNTVLATSLLFTASCGDKKSEESAALKAAENAKAEFVKYSSEEGIVGLIGEMLATDPTITRAFAMGGQEELTVEDITNKIKEYSNIRIENSGIETSAKDGLGVLNVKKPVFLIELEEGKLPEGADIPADLALKVTYPDVVSYIDPNKKAEFSYVSNGQMDFLVRGLPNELPMQFFTRGEDGYTKIFAVSGDSKGKIKYNESFGDENGSFYPYSSEHDVTDLQFKEAKGNTAVLRADSMESTQEVSEHNKERTVSSSQIAVKNLQLGDMPRMFLGDVKPIDMYMDIDSAFEYKQVDANAEESYAPEIMPFKTMNLGIKKMQIQTAGAELDIEGTFDMADNATQDRPYAQPSVDVDMVVKVTNYQALTKYIRSMIPFIPPQITNEKLFAAAKEIAGTSSDSELKFKIAGNAEDGFTVNGKTDDEMESIFSSHFGPK